MNTKQKINLAVATLHSVTGFLQDTGHIVTVIVTPDEVPQLHIDKLDEAKATRIAEFAKRDAAKAAKAAKPEAAKKEATKTDDPHKDLYGRPLLGAYIGDKIKAIRSEESAHDINTKTIKNMAFCNIRKEPTEGCLWVNVYKNDIGGQLYENKIHAEKNAGDKVVTQLPVEVMTNMSRESANELAGLNLSRAQVDKLINKLATLMS